MSDSTPATAAYPCALCDAPLSVADNVNGGIITVNVGGHGRAAHRECPTTTAASEDDAVTNALHIRLVCWDHKHVQVISAEALRQIVIAPICTAPTDNGICGSPIWAVEHEGEPTRYVGRPPHQGWASWADCVGAT